MRAAIRDLREGREQPGQISGPMPMPVSLHANSMRRVPCGAACSCAPRSRTSPRSVNLTALVPRLSSTCDRRWRSPVTRRRQRRFRVDAKRMSFAARLRAEQRSSSSSRPRSSKALGRSSSFSASIFEKSRMSLMIRSSDSPLPAEDVEQLFLLRIRRHCRAAGPRHPACRSWACGFRGSSWRGRSPSARFALSAAAALRSASARALRIFATMAAANWRSWCATAPAPIDNSGDHRKRHVEHACGSTRCAHRACRAPCPARACRPAAPVAVADGRGGTQIAVPVGVGPRLRIRVFLSIAERRLVGGVAQLVQHHDRIGRPARYPGRGTESRCRAPSRCGHRDRRRCKRK